MLVIDRHPLMPTDSAVRSAIDQLAERLAKAGVKVANTSALLPDLADSARLYMRLLGSAKSASVPRDLYEKTQSAATALRPSDNSLGAERTRGTVMSHRDWLARPPRFRPSRRTIRCRLRRDTLRSTARRTPITRVFCVGGSCHHVRPPSHRRADRSFADWSANRDTNHRTLSRGSHDYRFC